MLTSSRRTLLSGGLAAPFVRVSRVEAAWAAPSSPRKYVPAGTPIAIDWSRSFTNGLINLFDLTQAQPVDLVKNFGSLTSGAGGAIVSTAIGPGLQITDGVLNNGIWRTGGSPLSIAGTSACSVAALVTTPSSWHIPAVVIELCQSTEPLYRYGFNVNTPNTAVSMNPHLYVGSATIVQNGAALALNTSYHMATTVLMSDGPPIGNLIGYLNGAQDSLTTIGSAIFPDYDNVCIGCRVNAGISSPTGTFTNGSPVVSPTSLSNVYIGSGITGVSGIPANTFILRTGAVIPTLPTMTSFNMSANFTGTTGSYSYSTLPPMSTGNIIIMFPAVWNRELSAAEVAALGADYTGWILHSSDLHRFGMERDIMRWLRRNEEWRERRMAA